MTRTLAILIGTFLLFTATADAAVLNGKMLTQCGVVHNADGTPLIGNIDPIVSPGTVSAHPHTGAGSQGWSTTSNWVSLRQAPTNCAIPGNGSVYWAPAGVKNGVLIGLQVFHVYYAAGGRDTRGILNGRIIGFLPGFQMVAGNRTGSSPPSTSIATWRCTDETHIGRTIPADCAGRSVKLTFTYPSCSDDRPDSANHEDHVAYPVNETLGTGEVIRACPPTHPIALPQLIAEFVYPPQMAGAKLSSDDAGDLPGTKTHVDYQNGWDPAPLQQIVNCQSDQAHSKGGVAECGTVTSTSAAVSLMRTATDYRYVNATGGINP